MEIHVSYSVVFRADVQRTLFQLNGLYTIEVSQNYRICNFRIISLLQCLGTQASYELPPVALGSLSALPS